MEIIKERKRRLFAYVMAVMVLVYMNPAVTVKAAGEVQFTVRVTEGSTISSEGWAQGSQAEGKILYTKTYDAGATVEVVGTTPGGQGTHYIVDWSQYGNSGEHVYGSGFEIPATDPSGTTYDYEGIWGSYIKITYGGKTIAEGIQKTIDGSDLLTFTRPSLTDDMLCQGGKFFNNIWTVTASDIYNNTQVTIPLDEKTTISEFSSVIDFDTAEFIAEITPDSNNYTETQVPDAGGSFDLTQGTQYTIGTSENGWSINGDTCTYADGVTFYVPSDGTYTFKKK